MKHFVKLFAGLALASTMAACSQQAADEPAAAAAPTESAEEFVARVNDELVDIGKEAAAAQWVRSTYITGDTAVIASASSERYAKWHSESVQQALAYEDVELDATTRRGLDLLKLGTSAPSPHRRSRPPSYRWRRACRVVLRPFRKARWPGTRYPC